VGPPPHVGPPLPSPSPPRRDAVTKTRTLTFIVPEQPDVLFHIGDPDRIEAQVAKLRAKKGRS
jgi:hypothetical protein